MDDLDQRYDGVRRVRILSCTLRYDCSQKNGEGQPISGGPAKNLSFYGVLVDIFFKFRREAL